MAGDGDDLEGRLAAAFERDPGDGLGGSDMHALADEICAAGDWDDLVVVRDELRRRAGSEAEAAKYRPGPHGEWVLTFSSPTGRYALGLTIFNDALRRCAPAATALQGIAVKLSDAKVLDIAERFSWSELDPVVTDRNLRRLLARERVARGEDLRDAGIAVTEGEPPLYLEPWEPRTYWKPPHEVIWPAMNGTTHSPLPPPGTDLGRDPVLAMLERMARNLDERESVKVRGNALEAIAALGFSAADVAEMTLADMLAHVASRASSAPRGKTRLTDTGRRFAWELLATVAETFPPIAGASRSEALQHAGERVRWVSFYAIAEDEDVEEPWDEKLRQFFAIEDPERNIAWAMAAQGDPWW